MVTKKGAGKSKAAGGVSKTAGAVSKAAGGVSKTAGGVSKTAGGVSSAAGGVSKTAGAVSSAAGGGEVSGVDTATVYDAVELTAPTRTGRSLKNVANALEEFEFRLRVAEKYLSELRVALPGGEGFLAVGWTAARVLREDPTDPGDGAVARAARAAAIEVAGVVRSIVTRTTRPGDPARESVLLGEVLEAKLITSVKRCEQILKGAKEIQGSFPALTDELLKELAVVVDAAAKASGERKSERATKAVERLSVSDQRQLATDVLLDCADHLGSAALATLRASNPKVVERLCRALEPDGSEEKAPAPTP